MKWLVKFLLNVIIGPSYPTVKVDNSLVYFMGQDGLYTFDGDKVEKL